MDLELEAILNNLYREEMEYKNYLDYIKQRQIVRYDNNPVLIFNYFMLSINLFFVINLFHILTLNETIKIEFNKKK